MASDPRRTERRRCATEADTARLGWALGHACSGGEVLLLRGTLGAGKTAFVRGLARGLGVDPEEIRSPTFTLVNLHQGRVPLYHVDLYRIDSLQDLEELGLEDAFDGESVTAIEWPERLVGHRPDDRTVELHLTVEPDEVRCIELLAAARLLDALAVPPPTDA